jgi:phosphoenolpyruvate synthase/pyruvate phosphate dikinase
MTDESRSPSSVRWFAEIGIDDIPLVGGKNASRGEMYRALGSRSVKIPNGFAVTAAAYRDFLERSQLVAAHGPILGLKKTLDFPAPGALDSN